MTTDRSHYLKFGAMIATAMIAMYAITYLNTFEADHIHFSETRLYMTFLMGASMTAIMLGFMLNMYRDGKLNIAIAIGAVLVFALALWLVRSQALVKDESYMNAMIPHHSIAILTSERAGISDLRVRELADAIAQAQRREIAEMKWLLDDIAENGKAESEAEALARPVPDFEAQQE